MASPSTVLQKAAFWCSFIFFPVHWCHPFFVKLKLFLRLATRREETAMQTNLLPTSCNVCSHLPLSSCPRCSRMSSQCVWPHSTAWINRRSQSIALTAVLVNPLLNSCSFRSLEWQKCQTAAHAQSCIAFFFFFSQQLCIFVHRGGSQWWSYFCGVGWGESMPGLMSLREQRVNSPTGKCPFSRGTLQKLLLLYGCLQLGRNYPRA